MQGDEARVLLGFPPNSRPSPSQVKAAYRRKVWESHPDLFSVHHKSQAESKFKLVKAAYRRKVWESHPDLFSVHHKSQAESKFKLISEAYISLQSGARGEGLAPDLYARVVRTGVPRAQGGRRNHGLISVPFLFIILGTITLGGINAARAYKKQKEAYPSHNPFLP